MSSEGLWGPLYGRVGLHKRALLLPCDCWRCPWHTATSKHQSGSAKGKPNSHGHGEGTKGLVLTISSYRGKPFGAVSTINWPPLESLPHPVCASRWKRAVSTACCSAPGGKCWPGNQGKRDWELLWGHDAPRPWHAALRQEPAQPGNHQHTAVIS